MNLGRVKWYHSDKGYGFIETDKGKQVYVHRTGLLSSFSRLYKGQKVVFDIKQGYNGDIAYNVK